MSFFKSRKRIITVCLISLMLIIAVIYVGRNPKYVKSLTKLLPPFAFVHKQELHLTVRKIYLKCKHTVITQKSFAAEKVLKDYAGKLIRGKSYRKQNADKYSYLYTITSNAFCNICKKNHFLGIRDKQVVVVYGTTEKPGPIQENTGIDISKLPNSEIHDLIKGIPLKDEKEKLQLIEGLKSFSY